jgi:diguanylate cyclase (GGDEF)-like protein
MVFHDVSTARARSQPMSCLAQHDSLTNLPNNILFNDRLTQAMALAKRHQEKMAVLFLHLDGFKHIRDSLGHAIGDRLLQSVTKRLRACVRRTDTISRQVGDEFVILLSEVTHAKAAAVRAEKIMLALSTPHRIDQHHLQLTASIGIATYPDDGPNSATLTQHAEAAMRHAKEVGGNNFQFFKPDLTVHTGER